MRENVGIKITPNEWLWYLAGEILVTKGKIQRIYSVIFLSTISFIIRLQIYDQCQPTRWNTRTRNLFSPFDKLAIDPHPNPFPFLLLKVIPLGTRDTSSTWIINDFYTLYTRSKGKYFTLNSPFDWSQFAINFLKNKKSLLLAQQFMSYTPVNCSRYQIQTIMCNYVHASEREKRKLAAWNLVEMQTGLDGKRGKF